MDMFAATSGGTSSTCGFRRGLEAGGGSTFRGNALGFQVHAAGPCVRTPPPAPPAPALLAADTGPGPRKAYECSALHGFLGQLDVGLGETWAARLVRARHGYGIGAAVLASTGVQEGFLVFLSDSDQVLATMPLIAPQEDGTTIHLRQPRALLVQDTLGGFGDVGNIPAVVTIVGNGVLVDSDGVTVLLSDVVLATVRVSGCILCAPTMLIGNGVTWSTDPDAPAATYYDLCPAPCEPGMVYVCGSAPFTGSATSAAAMVALVDTSTGVAIQYLVLSSVPGSVAVSLGMSFALLAMGVNVGSGGSADALVWSTTPAAETTPFASVAPFPSPYNTQYNSTSTSRLRRPSNTLTMTIVRVITHTCGGIMVVARAGLGASPVIPTQVLALYAFDSSTAPITSFGDQGILVWYVPDAGTTSTTQPTDALLASDGSLVVVGNAFPAGTASFVYNATLPYLTTPAPGVGVPPRPFALQVKSCTRAWCCCCCDGTLPPVLQPLVSNLPGCAYARLVSAAFFTSPLCLHMVGDVFPHGCGVPAQAAGVLHALVSLTCPPRVLNAAAVGLPPGASSGLVRVDTVCGATGRSTLLVSGPVVVGSICSGDEDALPIPGSILFDPYAQAFIGYDGTQWRQIAWMPLT